MTAIVHTLPPPYSAPGYVQSNPLADPPSYNLYQTGIKLSEADVPQWEIKILLNDDDPNKQVYYHPGDFLTGLVVYVPANDTVVDSFSISLMVKDFIVPRYKNPEVIRKETVSKLNFPRTALPEDRIMRRNIKYVFPFEIEIPAEYKLQCPHNCRSHNSLKSSTSMIDSEDCSRKEKQYISPVWTRYFLSVSAKRHLHSQLCYSIKDYSIPIIMRGDSFVNNDNSNNQENNLSSAARMETPTNQAHILHTQSPPQQIVLTEKAPLQLNLPCYKSRQSIYWENHPIRFKRFKTSRRRRAEATGIGSFELVAQDVPVLELEQSYASINPSIILKGIFTRSSSTTTIPVIEQIKVVLVQKTGYVMGKHLDHGYREKDFDDIIKDKIDLATFSFDDDKTMMKHVLLDSKSTQLCDITVPLPLHECLEKQAKAAAIKRVRSHQLNYTLLTPSFDSCASSRRHEISVEVTFKPTFLVGSAGSCKNTMTLSFPVEIVASISGITAPYTYT